VRRKGEAVRETAITGSLRTWIWATYGLLFGVLIGLCTGYLVYKLTNDEQVFCPTRAACSHVAGPLHSTLVGGGVGAALGLVLALRLSRREH
jgi:hypothetical protein